MKKKILWPFYLIVIAVLLIPIAIIVDEIVNPEVEVDFASIENAPRPGTSSTKPDLAIISEKEDTYALQSTISSASISQLVDLDYKAYFALVVYQGRKPTAGYNVEIQRVTHQGNTVRIYVHFTERDPAKPAAEVETSPYHLVKIQREGIKGELVFAVVADGKEVLRQTATVL